MKKLSMLAAAGLAILLTACGNKNTQSAEADDLAITFEQEQIEVDIKTNLDSLAIVVSKLKQLPFMKDEKGNIVLTDDEKKVKPDFLLSPAIVDKATTLSEKYRALVALQVDKRVAELYEMPVDDYDKAITKLLAELNDPSFKAIENTATFYETTEALYNAMNENGRINFFWQMAAASAVEQLYIISKKKDKFLGSLDDDTASNITFRVVLLQDGITRLAEFDPELSPVAEALAPLDVLNATNVEELKQQIGGIADEIAASRKALLQ